MFANIVCLLYNYIRPLLKWFLHRFTTLTELQRICYGAEEGSARTKGVERSLRMSRCRAIKELLIYLDHRVQEELTAADFARNVVLRAARTVVAVKQIDMRIHPDFLPILRGCVESIWGYQRLYHCVETLRVTQYDSGDLTHEHRLYELWNLLNPNEQLETRITKRWQDIGFQGDDPKTDFRGMGLLGLENLLYFCREYNGAARHVLSHSLHPQHGYTFAIVGINLTSMAYKLYKSGAAKTHFYNVSRKCPTIDAFHKFYCYLFYEFDRYWMECKPMSIMDFSFINEKFETSILKQLAETKTYFRINLAVENV